MNKNGSLKFEERTRESLLSSFTEPKRGGPEREGIIVIEPGTLTS